MEDKEILQAFNRFQKESCLERATVLARNLSTKLLRLARAHCLDITSARILEFRLLLTCFYKRVEDATSFSYITSGIVQSKRFLTGGLCDVVVMAIKREEEMKRDDNYTFLEWFLHQLTDNRIVIDGLRATESTLPSNSLYVDEDVQYHTTFEYAMTEGSPKSVLSLLQFAKGVDGRYLVTVCQKIMLKVVELVASGVIEDIQQISESALPLSLGNDVLKLNLLLRMDISPARSVRSVCQSIRCGLNQQMKLEIFNRLCPDFEVKEKTPPSLKHSCKFRIRECLYDNWNLPRGIKELDIPVILKEYLALKDI